IFGEHNLSSSPLATRHCFFSAAGGGGGGVQVTPSQISATSHPSPCQWRGAGGEDVTLSPAVTPCGLQPPSEMTSRCRDSMYAVRCYSGFPPVLLCVLCVSVVQPFAF